MQKIYTYLVIPVIVLGSLFLTNCEKDAPNQPAAPGTGLSLDSISATKKHIVVWEEILVTAYAQGENLQYQWETNHGSMLGKDSVTVRYWGCPSCVGLNTIKCTVSNELGFVSDTIMVQVDP